MQLFELTWRNVCTVTRAGNNNVSLISRVKCFTCAEILNCYEMGTNMPGTFN